jgi:hypothetical protein
MLKSHRPMVALLCAVLLACCAWAMPLLPQSKQKKPAAQPPAQQPAPADQTQTPPPSADQTADQPKAITSGTAPTLKESRQRKEAASAGYNGLGDDGAVTPAALNSTPSADASQRALRLSVYAVSEADVQAFIKDGNLAGAK